MQCNLPTKASPSLSKVSVRTRTFPSWPVDFWPTCFSTACCCWHCLLFLVVCSWFAYCWLSCAERNVQQVSCQTVLLTDDRNLRVKAHARLMPTRDITSFVKWLRSWGSLHPNLLSCSTSLLHTDTCICHPVGQLHQMPVFWHSPFLLNVLSKSFVHLKKKRASKRTQQ